MCHHHVTTTCQGVFGWPSLEGVDPSALRPLPPTSSPLAEGLHALLEGLRTQRQGGGSWMNLRVVKQGDGDAGMVRSLVEDQTKQMMSYAEFLVHCHRYVISKVG